VIGKKNPRSQIKRMQRPRAAEGARQEAEIELAQLGAPFEQPHRDEDISIRKKRTPEPKHGRTIRHREDDWQSE
jgi:hypothetical protein